MVVNLGVLSLTVGMQLDHDPSRLLGAILLGCTGYSWLSVLWRSRGLRISVQRPSCCRALEASPLTVMVEAPRPLRSLVVTDPDRPSWSPSGAFTQRDEGHEPAWEARPGRGGAARGRRPRTLRGPGRSPIPGGERRGSGPRVMFEEVAAGGVTRGRAFEIWPRRGLVQPGPLVARFSRPLGLVAMEVPADPGAPIVVLPAPGRLERRALERLTGFRPFPAAPRDRPGQGAEIRCLRPYLPGDSHRQIHWPTTARMGEIMVRECEDESDGATLVVGLGWRRGRRRDQRMQVEAAVSLVATLLQQCRRSISLVLPGRDVLPLAGRSRRNLRRALIALALLDGDVGWPDLEGAGASVRVARKILIHPGGQKPPPFPGDVMVVDVGEMLSRGEFVPRGRRLP